MGTISASPDTDKRSSIILRNAASSSFPYSLNPLHNTMGDITLLPKVLDAASRFERRPSDEEMTTMLDTTRVTSLFGLPT